MRADANLTTKPTEGGRMSTGPEVINVAPEDAPALPIEDDGAVGDIVRIETPPETADGYAGIEGVVIGPGVGAEALVSYCERVVSRAPDVSVLVYTDEGN